jgi:hypothetical protein
MKSVRIFTAWTVITISYIVLHLVIFREASIYQSLFLVFLLNMLAPVLCPFLILCFLSPKYTDDQVLLRGSYFDGVSLSKKRAPKYRIFKSSRLNRGAIFFPRLFSEHFVVISENFKLNNRKDTTLSEKVFVEGYSYYFVFYYFFPMLLTFAFLAYCLEQLNFLFKQKIKLFSYLREVVDFISTPFFYLLDGTIANQFDPMDFDNKTLVKFFAQSYRYQRIDMPSGINN